MKRAKWIGILGLLALAWVPGCKKGVDTASEPLREQAQGHYVKARRLFLTCDPDKYMDAIKEYQLALNYWDEYPEALAGMAEAISMWRGYSLSEEQFGQAYQYAQRSLRLNPDLPDGYRAMADLFRHRREYDRALRQIELAIKLNPNSAENYYVKGSALLESNPEEAAKVLIQAQKLNPDLPKTYFNLASAAQKLGNFDEALKNLEIYRKMAPNDISTYCSLGMIYLNKISREPSEEGKQKLQDQGVEQLKLTIAKSDAKNKPWQAPWVVLAAKTLARLAIERKDYPEALTYLKKSEEIYSEDSELHYFYGQVYKALGNKAEARKHLEKALKLSPDNQDLKNELKGM